MLLKYKSTAAVLITVCMMVAFLLSGCSSAKGGTGSSQPKETVNITIGYQSVTAQTWGALIIKNQKLYEKYLEKAYPNKTFHIDWFNAQSGPPLTNNMVAGKIQISFMGDMPLLLNGEIGQTSANYKSVFIAFDGKGKSGSNQAIIVPNGSNITSVKDLAGKTVSVPLGSSAHKMLLDELNKYGITNKVTILNQDVTVGMTNIQQSKVDAYATWEPFPNLITSKNTGKILISGSDTGIDYLDGVVADRTWAEKNKGYTVAFLQALLEAHQFILKNPGTAAKIFSKETGYPTNVTEPLAKSIRFDSVIYDKDRVTLSGSEDFLKQQKKLNALDLSKFIDSEYLQKAYKASNVTYPSTKDLKGNWLSLK